MVKIKKSNVQDIFELSTVQKGMLFHYLEGRDENLYNVQLSLQLEGALDINLLKKALYKVQSKNEVLRSVFSWDKATKPLQIILKDCPLDFLYYDLSAKTAEEATRLLEKHTAKDQKERFDLGSLPLRVSLIKLSATSFVLNITHHHILYDGWSTGVFLKELFDVYRQLTKGESIKILDKGSFKETYLDIRKKAGRQAATDYWKGYMARAEPASLFSQKHPGDERSGQVSRLTYQLPLDGLEQLSARYKVTKATIMYAIFGILMQKYSQGAEAIFGIVVSNRDSSVHGVDSVMGNFINTVPIRIADAADSSLNDLFARVQQDLIASEDHKFTAYHDLKKTLGLRPSQELFDAILAVENYPLDEAAINQHFSVSLRSVYENTGIPLAVSIFFKEELEIEFAYQQDYIDHTFLQSFAGHFIKVTKDVLAGFEGDVRSLSLMTQTEKKQLLYDFNNTFADYPREATIQELFQKQVASSPDAVALVFEQRQLSYQELDQRSNQLARQLLDMGARPGNNIAIVMERSLEMIIAIFGILKAGATYVPLNREYPIERLQYILEDTDSSHIVYSDEALLDEAFSSAVAVDCKKSADYPTDPVNLIYHVEDFAYIMYTSGTTGRPKGIRITQTNVLKLAHEKGAISVRSSDRMIQWSNYAFDGCTYEIFNALLNGASLCMIPGSAAANPAELARIIREQEITVFFVTTALFNAIVDYDVTAFQGLRKLLFGGELVSVAHVQKALDYMGTDRLVHVYGPTETTTYATYFPINSYDNTSTIPIGYALSNTTTYVLDEAAQLSPLGVVGELYIGGLGVSRGYLNLDELSRERFVPNPFDPDNFDNSRLYRTGDLVRRLPDGSLDFIGRRDSQVKLRGYRIELGEIERQIEQLDKVREAVVLIKEINGLKRLLTYVLHEPGFDASVAREQLKKQIPDYMVPALFIPMDHFPLNPNGKVDQAALPQPDIDSLGSEEYRAPTSATEVALAGIWQELLGVSRIGKNDHFFELGGDSILATRLASLIKNKLSVAVSIRSLFEYPKLGELAEHIDGQEASSTQDIPLVADKGDRIPLSFAQERLWFIDQLEGSHHYHVPVVLTANGAIDRELLCQSVQQLVNRQESLRTIFQEEKGQAYQTLLPRNTWTAHDLVDVSQLASDEIELQIQRYVNQPFDLSKDHMIRLRILRAASGVDKLVLVMHHIAFDGWSVTPFIEELRQICQGLSSGQGVQLDALPIQYSDYCLWQRTHLTGERIEEQLAYWEQKLQGVESLELPLDYARPSKTSYRGDNHRFSIDKTLSDELRDLAAAEGVSHFMLTLAIFKVLLYRYSGQNDICVGTPIANREQAEVADLIGFFVNTLAVRSHLDSQKTFLEMLYELKTSMLEAQENQQVPFEKVIDHTTTQRDLSRTPLFQVMFALQKDIADMDIHLGDVQLTPSYVNTETSKFELTVNLRESKEGLTIDVEYATDLFKPSTIQQMGKHFESLMRAIVDQPTQRIGDLKMLTPYEKNQLLYSFNATTADYPRAKTIQELFEQRVRLHPQADAVAFGNGKLNYRELDEISNRLAHLLLDSGASPGSNIAIVMERGIDMIVSMLAILKVGCAYVPLNTEYPIDRLQYILEDAAATHIIYNDPSLLDDAFASAQPVDCRDCSKHSAQALELSYEVEDIAYIMYTSGTTGKPKGIRITQTNILKLAHEKGPIAVRDTDRVIQWSNYAFDGSTYDIYSSLLNGGSLYMIPQSAASNPAELAALIRQHDITVFFVTTALFNAIVDYDVTVFKGLRKLLFGGELVSVAHVQKALDHMGPDRLVHVYGPTETTTYATYYPINAYENTATIPIGYPLSNTSTYVLDPSGNLCAIGIVGELYIGGLGVSKGYLNLPELSKERFIANPFDKQNPDHQILYRTGDLVRRLSDGSLEFIGRTDSQVKLRGYRIELGEIERQIEQLPHIREAVVLIREINGRKRLLTYVLVTEGFEATAAKEELLEQLPDYMVPSLFIPMESFPLNPNGKVDQRALPEPALLDLASEEFVAAQTETEVALASIWQELLGVEQVGVHDNFFELGGDSILAIQFVSRAKDRGFTFKVKDVFSHQSIAKLAGQVRAEGAQQAEQGMLTGELGMLPIQQNFFARSLQQADHFNQSVLLEIDKQIDEEQVRQAITAIVEQHDALRLIYQFEDDQQPRQSYGEAAATLELVDILHTENSQEEITAICEQYQKSLSIKEGTLHRFVLIQTPSTEESNRLFILVHHLAVDGVSWRILLGQLSSALSDLAAGKAIDLGRKTSSYRQWQTLLTEAASSKLMSTEMAHWKNALKEVSALPQDKDYNGPSSFRNTRHHELVFSAEETTNLLQHSHHAYNTEINDLLLTALAESIGAWKNDGDILLGLEGHGREELSDCIDLSRTIGWFTSLFPLRLRLPQTDAIADHIIAVKEQLRRIPNKGMGFGILRHLHPKYSQDAILQKEFDQLVFNYLGNFDLTLAQDAAIRPATESTGTDIGLDNENPNQLGVNGMVQNGQLTMVWSFDENRFEASTIEQLAADYKQKLLAIVAHCMAQDESVATPSDYGLADMASHEKLTAFLAADHPYEVEDVYRLSPLQEGMLFHSLYDQDANGYNVQFSCEFANGMDQNHFHQAWAQVIREHSSLRTAYFSEPFDAAVQAVFQNADIPLVELDCSHLQGEELEAQIEKLQREDKQKAFDLRQAPLLRITLVKLPAERVKMILTSHHILWDGWSFSVLLSEFLSHYDALVKGETLVEKPVDNYRDFIQYLDGLSKLDATNHWKQSLASLQAPSLLPFIDGAAERNKHFGNRTDHCLIDRELTERIQKLAQECRVTINTVLQGAWSFLLSKYTNAKQVAFGTTVSGRVSALEQIESRIGLFINTIPISIGIEEDSSIGDWLAQIQQQHTASREYQHTPLADIQSIAGLTTELFDSILVFENYPVEEAAKASTSLQIERIEAEEQNNYALTLTVVAEEELLIRFSYNNAVLDERYVKTMMAQLRQVLSEISLGAQREVQTINWIPAAEKNLLLDEFNDTAARYPEGETVLEVFEQQVQKRGGQTAISFEGAELTYVELNQKSDQLAAYLRQQGVESSSIVPICMNRSLEMIIGILGVLKTGASFVPIDPEMPQDRTDYILEDIGSPLLISMQNQRRATSASSRVTRIELDADWPLIDAVEGENIHSHFPTASDLAYTIYTSGTTGRPKGVMIEHKALHNFICSMTDNLGADENLRFLSVTTFSFDIAYLEFFLPLTSGGCLIMAGDQLAADPARLIPYIDGNAPTHMQATPSRWQMLLDAGWRNEAQVNVLTGGEAISESLKDRLVALGQDKTWNMYGPTETTIWSSMCELNPQQAVRIGQPIANTQIYILTEDLAVQPIGLWGELYIGGDGLARGYFKRPDLTSERFVEHTFADGSTRRLYRTGDVARWLPDGQIEYSGRVDYQVKIRGYRIELAEIETILEEVEGIGRAVASVGQDKRGNKHLIAYVVADGAFDAVRTKKYLKQKLPSYMLPNCFVELEDLPLTPNGKVDRKALPQPDGNELGRKEYIAPANELEASIAGIWEKFLGLESIGVEDDFFDLGGHSLLANRIVVAIQAELGISTPIRTLFQHPTIRDFAASISTGQHDKEVSIPKVLDKPERIPLSYGQERLWFVDKFEGSTHYHMPLILDLDGPVDVAILEQSVQYLVNRYQALRTIFKEEDAVPYQCVLPENNWQLGPIIDASEWEEEKTQQHIQALINQPFDLQKDHMIRAAVVHTDKEYDTLVMVIHHIAFDGWSLLIFAEELTKVYRALAAEQQPELAELPVDYTDYSIWQRDYLSGDRLKEHLAYWSEKLEDVEPLNLPTDFIRPAHKTTAGSSVDIALGKDLSDQLERLARQEDATLFMVLLSVLKVLLHRYSGQTDICIGTPIANREQVEVEQLIGYFINTLALRSDLSGQPSFRELLRLVRDNTLEAYEYQQTPFEKVIDDNITHRDLSRTPLFQVMLVLQNFAAVSELYFGETQAQAVDFDMGISKYDLNFIVLPSADGLEISIEYSSDLFERATIERMAQHFNVLLTEAAKNPFCRIDQLPMLTQAESQQILFDFNDTDHPYAVDKTMVEIFEEQVERTPDQIAIISNGKSYSYDWLNKASNRLAHYLREQGVGRETSVVVVMDRDVRLIAALFGILKAGGKYIPIEPYLPENRKLTVMNTVETKIFVTNNTDYLSPAAHREQVASIHKMICLQEDADFFIGIDEHEQDQIEAVDVETYPVTNPNRINEVSDLAYVIFTSGSTGTPKGVAVQHKPAINLIEWVNNTYGVGESDKILMVSSVSFDLSVYDIFGGLSAGATLRIANRTELDDPEILANIIIEEGITFWDSAPAMLQQVIPFLEIRQADTKAKGKLRLSFSSGDWIPLQMPVQMRNLFSDDYRFIALGGATEATIWSNFFEPTEIDKNWRSIPYGKPIQNAKYLVLDDDKKLCPIGVPGNLFIGGQCLAVGYLNDPELSDRKFIPSPYYEGEMLYNTGDTARWFADGNLEFLGRKDFQVKIRGYRIELGDIESRLLQLDGIEQVLAHAIARSKYDKFICAYYVAERDFEEEEMSTFINEDLPAYMIPDHFIRLDKIPMTKNGKVDRKALPTPEVGSKEAQIKVATSDAEKVIAAIWSELLAIEEDKFGVTDNFFDLGGHSILAVRLISKLQQELQAVLKLREIFEHPTIEQQADLISHKKAAAAKHIPSIGERQVYQMSSAQRRMFYEYLQDPSNLKYNIAGAYQLEASIDLDQLTNALTTLVNRHEGLRTGFELTDEGAMQMIHEQVALSLDAYRKEDHPTAKDAFAEFVRPFDLMDQSQIRFGLYQDKGQNTLFVDVHHIVCDGLSLNILMKDFQAIYKGEQLEDMSIRYVDFAHWQNALLDQLSDQQLYWKERLSGDLPTLELPRMGNKDMLDFTDASVQELQIEGEWYDRLKSMSSQSNASDFMLLLSIYYLLLSKISGSNDIIIGTDVVGRTQPELRKLVGTFVNILPLRMDIRDDQSYEAFLAELKEMVLNAFDNQDFQIDQMIAMLDEQNGVAQGYIVDVHFSMANYYDKDLESFGFGQAQVEQQMKSAYEFKLEVHESDDRFTVKFIYSTQLYEDAIMTALMTYYDNILRFVLDAPSTPIGDISYDG